MHLPTAQSESILHETQKNRTSSIIFRTNNIESFHSIYEHVNFMRDPFVPLVMCGVVVVLKLCNCSIPSTAGVPSGLSSGHWVSHTERHLYTGSLGQKYSLLMCDGLMASIEYTAPDLPLFSPHANGCIWGPWTRTDSCSLPLIRIAANDLQTKSWAIFVKECFKSEGTHSKFRIEIRVPCGILIEYEATIKQH